jgi:hypothetical protein
VLNDYQTDLHDHINQTRLAVDLTRVGNIGKSVGRVDNEVPQELLCRRLDLLHRTACNIGR